MAELGISCLLGLHNPEIDAIEVSIEMLDYGYVQNLKLEDRSTPNTLRAILKKLRSGKEGRYPHLEQYVTDQLIKALPEGPKIKQRLSMMDESKHIGHDKEEQMKFNDWLSQIEKSACHLANDLFDDRQSIFYPAPRNKKTNGNTNILKMKDMKSIETKISVKSNRICKEKLSNKDYFEAWDKMDIDAMEKELDNPVSDIDTKDQLTNKKASVNIYKRVQDYQNISDVQKKYHMNSLTNQERQHMANIERNKGNEFFRTKDLEMAIECYTKSIAYYDSNAILYTNRAIACIRLNQLQQAMFDCNKALSLDSTCMKAYLRRGMIHYKYGRYEEAIHDFEICCKEEPKNSYYEKWLKQSKKKLHDIHGTDEHEKYKKRIVIKDIDSKQEQKNPERKLRQTKKVERKEETQEILEFYTPGALEDEKKKNDDKQSKIKRQTLKKKLISDNKQNPKNVNNRNFVQETKINNDESKMNHDIKFHKIPILECDSDSDSDSDSETDDDEMEKNRRNLEKNGQSHKCNDKNENSKSDNEWKEYGNVAMSQNNYTKAIQMYNKALEKNPKNIAARNNRSLVYLKMGKYKEAELDADKCLQLDENKNRYHIKALYRRGMARKLQNLEEKVRLAHNDFQSILQTNSNNLLVQKELKSCESLLQHFIQSKSKLKNVENNNFTKESNQLCNALPDPPSNPISNAKQTNSCTNINYPPLPPPKTLLKHQTIYINDANPNMTIPEIPNTVSKMESTIRKMKQINQTHLIIDYLNQFSKQDFKKVFKRTLSSDILEIILNSFQQFNWKQKTKVIRIMYEIAKISSKLDLTIRCMNDEGKQSIQHILDDMVDDNDKRIRYIKNIFSKLIS